MFKIIQGLSHKAYNYREPYVIKFSKCIILILYFWSNSFPASFHGLISMTTPAMKLILNILDMVEQHWKVNLELVWQWVL